MEVYFDNSSTTKTFDEVITVMNNLMRDNYGNPSSMHAMGINAENAVNHARDIIALSINANSKEIVFTSGGTESNNIAIKGSAEANMRKGRHIITSKIEHSSVLNVFRELENKGYEVDYIGVSEDGVVNVEELINALRKDTILVSIMNVNNETGVIQPIEQIGKVVKLHSKNALFHVDAVQAFGKIPVDVRKLQTDMVTVSAHKIHGPKGVGALYVKDGTKLSPLFMGGGQEGGIRSGTENVPGICGFGTAVEIMQQKFEYSYKYVSQLRDAFISGLKENVDDFMLNPADTALCLPYIVNVSFIGVKAEVLLHSLAGEGIYISTGSACSSRSKQLSPVLQEMNLCRQNLQGAIRVSFSTLNTQDEILYAVKKLSDIVKGLRRYKRR